MDSEVRRVANPILHDFIKSIIHYQYKDVLDICRTIPKLKNSNLLKPSPSWIFERSIQEDTLRWGTKPDVSWLFRYYDDEFPSEYTVLHEIKTGDYSIDEIFKKYWHQGNLQIWVWGWKDLNKRIYPTIDYATKEYKRGFIKKIDIERLSPLIRKNFETLIYALGIGVMKGTIRPFEVNRE